jgi:heme exporter protein B
MSVNQHKSVDDKVATRAPAGFWASTVAVIYKDFVLEWRGRERMNATLFFAILVLLLFSFAIGADTKLLGRIAPGLLWMTLFMASVMSLGESMRIESDNDALEGLRLLPVDPRALFVGKAVINSIYLWLLGMALVPVLVAIYDVELKLGILRLSGVLAAGALAISAPGTIQAAIAIQAKARDVLLPLLLFPVLVPGLLAAVKATELIVHGDAMNQLGSWVSLLLAFAGIYWVLCTLLFGRVID